VSKYDTYYLNSEFHVGFTVFSIVRVCPCDRIKKIFYYFFYFVVRKSYFAVRIRSFVFFLFWQISGFYDCDNKIAAIPQSEAKVSRNLLGAGDARIFDDNVGLLYGGISGVLICRSSRVVVHKVDSALRIGSRFPACRKWRGVGGSGRGCLQCGIERLLDASRVVVGRSLGIVIDEENAALGI
jgi:hypothetical protein